MSGLMRRRCGSLMKDCEGAEREMTRLEKSMMWLAVVVLTLVTVGCQWGIGERAAPTPHPPPAPTFAPPTAVDATDHNEKVIDGYLHVRYIPCEPIPAAFVAPIILTDLRSGSVIFLNRNGTVKTSRTPRYSSEEGKAALEAVLNDSSIMEQVVARPTCQTGCISRMCVRGTAGPMHTRWILATHRCPRWRW